VKEQMTEHHRILGDPRLGFVTDELEGETCVDCGDPATVVYEDSEGLIHYCDQHDPRNA
jgi:hypothetical protein